MDQFLVIIFLPRVIRAIFLNTLLSPSPKSYNLLTIVGVSVFFTANSWKFQRAHIYRPQREWWYVILSSSNCLVHHSSKIFYFHLSLTDNISVLAQIKACQKQDTGLCLNQCWPIPVTWRYISMTPLSRQGRIQWAKSRLYETHPLILYIFFWIQFN